MHKLIQYTGGSIVLTIGATILAFFALIIGTIALFININKSHMIVKTKKIESAVLIISVIVLSMMVSGVISYYFGVYMML